MPVEKKREYEQSDQELMASYSSGSSLAFQELHRRYSSKIYGYIRRRAHNSNQIDDLYQAFFLKFHKTRSKYDSKIPLQAWIFTLCRNLMIDEIRKDKNSEKYKDQFQKESQTLQEFTREELNQEIDLPSLKTLPEKQKLAIQHRYMDDLSFEEIAKRLDTTPTNVRQLVSRGLKTLKIGLGLK